MQKKNFKKQIRQESESSDEEMEEVEPKVKSFEKGKVVTKKKHETLKEFDSETEINEAIENVELDEESTDGFASENEENVEINEDNIEENYDEFNVETFLEDYYSKVERAVLKDGNLIRQNDRTRDLNNKVFNIDTEKDYDKNDRLEMPPTGILKDGIPFHHLKAYTLLKKHIRRLYAHGIIYKTSKFTSKEDYQLVLNWKRYCAMFGVAVEDAPYYMGWIKNFNKEQLKEIKRKIKETKFHAYMSLNLIDRCALQVKRRCYRIFNPKDENWLQMLGSSRFTEEDDKKLMELYEILGNSWQEIGFRMNRNRFEVQKRYTILTEGGQRIWDTQKAEALKLKEFTPDLLEQLYNEVKNYLPIHPVYLILSANNLEVEKAENCVDWYKVAQQLAVFPDQCIEKWKDVKRILMKAYLRINDSNTNLKKVEEEAFPIAQNQPKLRKMKIQQAEKGFEILLELAKEQNITELFEIDVIELTKRLKNAGIIFHTVYTLGSRLLSLAHRIFHLLRHHDMLGLLPVKTTIIDLLEMLVFFCQKAENLRKLAISKRTVLKLIKEFVEKRGQELNPKYVIIYKNDLKRLVEEEKESVLKENQNKVKNDKMENDETEDEDDSDEEESEEEEPPMKKPKTFSKLKNMKKGIKTKF